MVFANGGGCAAPNPPLEASSICIANDQKCCMSQHIQPVEKPEMLHLTHFAGCSKNLMSINLVFDVVWAMMLHVIRGGHSFHACHSCLCSGGHWTSLPSKRRAPRTFNLQAFATKQSKPCGRLRQNATKCVRLLRSSASRRSQPAVSSFLWLLCRPGKNSILALKMEY